MINFFKSIPTTSIHVLFDLPLHILAAHLPE